MRIQSPELAAKRKRVGSWGYSTMHPCLGGSYLLSCKPMDCAGHDVHHKATAPTWNPNGAKPDNLWEEMGTVEMFTGTLW